MTDDDHMYPDNFSCTFESKLAEESIDDVGEFVVTLDELIISCVQSYTYLYNRNDKNYKDHVIPDSIRSPEDVLKTKKCPQDFLRMYFGCPLDICAVRNEGEILGRNCKDVSVCEVQQRWKRLNDRYIKERKLNENTMRSGNGIQQKKQCPLFKSLKFMKKHIQKRRYKNVPLRFRSKSQNNVSEELTHTAEMS